MFLDEFGCKYPTGFERESRVITNAGRPDPNLAVAGKDSVGYLTVSERRNVSNRRYLKGLVSVANNPGVTARTVWFLPCDGLV